VTTGTGRLAGSLVHRYTVDVPADPGWSQPWRHRESAPGAEVTRDEAPAGGGWQPSAWDQPIPALRGSSYGAPASHKGTGHRGDEGRGQYRPATELEEDASVVLGDPPAALRGSSGAAFGGLVKTGSMAPEANAPVMRRRADGGLVVNPGGVRLGERHIHTSDDRRQGLHVNRPTLRLIRVTAPARETSSPMPGQRGSGRTIRTSMFNPLARERTAGPVTPRSRRIFRPYGQTDHVEVDAAPSSAGIYDAGPVGDGSWVQ